MAGLKSLGLAGAKKAFSKLFRRGQAANDDDQATNTTSTTSTNASDEEVSETGPRRPSTPHTVTTTTTGAATAEDSAALPLGLTQQSRDGQGFEETARAAAGNQQPEHGTTDTMNTASLPSRGTTSLHFQGQQPRSVYAEQNKENIQPTPLSNSSNQVDSIIKPLAGLDLSNVKADGVPPVEGEPEAEPAVELDPEALAERQKHLRFIGEALEMARLALQTNETPVGCVLVHNDKVIARGMNATNVTRNGTRHAELMAIAALLSYAPKDSPKTTSLRPKNLPLPSRPDPLASKPDEGEGSETATITTIDSRPPDEGNEDGRKSHLYPYGQKEIPDERVDRAILRETTLYVTVEPCIMCASLLRQLGIKKVYFGAVNDKFGGTGGVFSIHANSLPVSEGEDSMAAHPTPRPAQLPDGSGTLGCSFPPGGGDGGNVEPGYEIEGGWGRDDAVGLLRRFYVQENGRAPVPRKKEGRAARLAAMMEQDGDVATTPELVAPGTPNEDGSISTEKAIRDTIINHYNASPAEPNLSGPGDATENKTSGQDTAILDLL